MVNIKQQPPTKTEAAALALSKFCTKGTVLAVDPSIGSASSMPGYAIAVDGVMVDSGILTINPREPHNKRLAGIQAQLRKLTPNPNVLICEAIAPMLSVGGANVIQLHWAVGAIQATFPDAGVLLIPNQTWKKYLRGVKLDNYIKCDETDALALLLTYFHLAKGMVINAEDVHTYMRNPTLP